MAHVRRNDWICRDHAIELLKNNSDVLGVLNRTQAELYESRRNGDHAREYRENGYTFVDLEAFSDMRYMKENICSSLVDRLLGEVGGSKLKMNLLANRYCRADGAPSSENIPNTHDGRTWLNIIPGEGCNSDRDWVKYFRCNVDGLGMMIEELLFPDLFFARKAKENGESLKEQPKVNYDLHPDRSVKHNYDEIMDVATVNVLAKGRCLNERQSMHVDGSGFKVVVILVHICGNEGYEFHIVPDSHNMLENHKGERKQKIPINEIQSLCFPRTKVFVFTENLIHGGGESKMSTEEYLKLVEGKWVNGVRLPRKGGQLYDGWNLSRGNRDINPVLAGEVNLPEQPTDLPEQPTELPEQPTELSFQLTFDYKPLSEGKDMGKAKPLWYKDEVNGSIKEGTLGKCEDFIQSKRSNRFGKKIDSQAEIWIKNLTTENVNRRLRARRH